jgi:electron transport complex protein RnfD
MINKQEAVGHLPDLWNMFLGNRAGSLGETSALALVLGGLYLLWRRQITWSIPLSYILTVFFGALVLRQNPLFHILAGGLFLGAIFMATDPVTSPVTEKGRVIFGIGCGVLTILIRLKGGFPEGVCFSILIMNMLVPLIDKVSVKRVFGK